jgi:serine/threonine-protein kinase
MKPSPPRQPGARVGDFVLEAPIGAGAMGTVYRARHAETGLPCAVKLLGEGALARPELRKRFEREAIALAHLRHPNVVEVLAIGVEGDEPFLATELLVGTSLEAVVQGARLTPERALRIGTDIIAGLAHAHARGLVHRDVKPENVFLVSTREGERAKLLDFGLVRFSDRSAGPSSFVTAMGTLMGSPAYMAPEQGFGEECSPRSDVYSAGVVLYELFTGSWPFVESDVPALLRAHALTAVPPMSEVRPELVPRKELERVITRALAKRPAERFTDAGELLEALRAVPLPVATLAF